MQDCFGLILRPWLPISLDLSKIADQVCFLSCCPIPKAVKCYETHKRRLLPCRVQGTGKAIKHPWGSVLLISKSLTPFSKAAKEKASRG